MPNCINVLAPQQIKLLEKCEAIIERGQKTFIEVARALHQIKEGKLYLRDYETFQDYCKVRWGWDRQRAFQLIKAAEVVENVNHGLQGNGPLPSSERQARPLAALPAEQQANAWADVVDECQERGEPVTAAAVQEMVSKYKAQAKPYREPEEEPEAEPRRRLPQERNPALRRVDTALSKAIGACDSKELASLCADWLSARLVDISPAAGDHNEPPEKLCWRYSAAVSAMTRQFIISNPGMSQGLIAIALQNLAEDFRKLADVDVQTEEPTTAEASSETSAHVSTEPSTAATSEPGEDDGDNAHDEDYAAQAAAMVGVPVKMVHRASRILASANSEVINAVERGRMTLDEAEAALRTTIAPRTITLHGKTLELQQQRGQWFFRASPDAGWTACSAEMVAMIKQEFDGAEQRTGDAA